MFQNTPDLHPSTISYMEIISLVVYLLLLLPFFLIFLDTFFRMFLLIVSQIPRIEGGKSVDCISNLRILYLIVANNEQGVIQESIERIKQVAGLADHDEIVVLADHCTDRTVEIAIEYEATIFQRHDGRPGKSEALSWFTTQAVKKLKESDLIVILDADTLVGEDFSTKIRTLFEQKVDVVQVLIRPITSEKSPLALLASYSEILSQKIDDEARSRLHWSVPLRGTGMIFRTEIFSEVCREINSQVDDIELSLLLMERAIPVHFYSQVEVLDPKASNMLGLARQRGRWLKGQRYIWNTQKGFYWKLLRLGLPNWSLMQSLILKPKTALMVLKILLICMLLSWSNGLWYYNLTLDLILGSILIDIFYYLTGLRYVSNPLKTFLAMFSVPMFLVLWIIRWGFSLIPGQGWLRARD